MKIVNDNYLYARVSKMIEDKSKLSEEHIPMLTEVLGDEDKAREVVEAGKASMGNNPFSSVYLYSFSLCFSDMSYLFCRPRSITT